VVLGERPPEVENLLERRRALGQDLFDEVWEGDYHMAPAPHGRHRLVDEQLSRILGPLADQAGLYGSGPCNIGHPEDYRVPDRAYFESRELDIFNPSAEVVVEIVSPGDESREKFDFYFRAGVAEMLIVDPDQRTVEWFTAGTSGFEPAERSTQLGISAAELSDRIDWP